MSGRSCKSLLCAAAAAGFLTAGAQAEVLLVVDLSVMNQVTITATNGLSAVTASGSDTTGVYFNNFYGVAGGSLADVLVAGDLTSAANTSDTSPDLYRATSGSDTGLNLWSWTDDTTVNFTAGAQAFSGSATWTLTAAEYADMVNGNTAGDLYFPADSSDDISSADLIGQYEVVVPTPGAVSMLALGLGAGAIRRRR